VEQSAVCQAVLSFPLRCSQLRSSPKEVAMCRHIRCAILASVWQIVDSLMSRVSFYRVIV